MTKFDYIFIAGLVCVGMFLAGMICEESIIETNTTDVYNHGKMDGWLEAIRATNDTVIGLYELNEMYYIHQPGIGIIKLYSQNRSDALGEMVKEATAMQDAPRGMNVMVINGVVNS